MDNQTLGERIRYFRKRAGLSQMELECEVELSAGTVSRIENNTTNPTKETLLKIINFLNLNDFEIATIFNLDIKDSLDILNLVNEFSQHTYYEDLIQTAVNTIAKYLKFRHVSVLLYKNGSLEAAYANQNINSTNATSLLGVPLHKIKVSFDLSENILVKCIKENEVVFSNNLYSACIGITDQDTANKIQRITKLNYFVVFPLIFKSYKLGCAIFVKDRSDSYEVELPILHALSRQLAIQIHKTRLLKYK